MIRGNLALKEKECKVYDKKKKVVTQSKKQKVYAGIIIAVGIVAGLIIKDVTFPAIMMIVGIFLLISKRKWIY